MISAWAIRTSPPRSTSSTSSPKRCNAGILTAIPSPAAFRACEKQRFDKAERAGNSTKGLVHYRNRLQKARRRGNARKIAKFERKVQKYKLAVAAVETS